MTATKTQAMKTYNNTTFTEEQIGGFLVLGHSVSKWRQRNNTLYQHPTDAERIISVGVTFDGSMKVICDDDRNAWGRELDYAAHGKVYVAE